MKVAGSPSRTTLPGTPAATVIPLDTLANKNPIQQTLSRHCHSETADFYFGALLQQNKKAYKSTSATETGNPRSNKYERLAPSLQTNRLHGQKYFGALLQQKVGALCSYKYEKRFTPSVRKSLSIRFRKPIKRTPLSIYWRTHPTKNHTRVLYKIHTSLVKYYISTQCYTFDVHLHHHSSIHTILCHKKNAKDKNKGIEI